MRNIILASSILKKAAEFVLGVGVAEGVYRAYDRYQLLTKDHKEHLFEKLTETASAFFSSKNRPENHVKLVFSLPSKEETKRRETLNIEKYIREHFGKSYLYESQTSHSEDAPSVYEYDPKQNNFLFAGRSKELMSLEARRAILAKKYVPCKLEEIFGSRDILITGSTSCDLCSLFNSYLRKETDSVVESEKAVFKDEIFI